MNPGDTFAPFVVQVLLLLGAALLLGELVAAWRRRRARRVAALRLALRALAELADPPPQ